jgi:hypothetical protein
VRTNEDPEPLNVEMFQVLAYQAGLRLEDLNLLTVGMVLDYIQEYIDQQKPTKEKKRKASQADFDAF